VTAWSPIFTHNLLLIIIHHIFIISCFTVSGNSFTAGNLPAIAGNVPIIYSKVSVIYSNISNFAVNVSSIADNIPVIADGNLFIADGEPAIEVAVRPMSVPLARMDHFRSRPGTPAAAGSGQRP
jgi:hypothetical protein